MPVQSRSIPSLASSPKSKSFFRALLRLPQVAGADVNLNDPALKQRSSQSSPNCCNALWSLMARPTASDVAVQANVGLQVNCGSVWRMLETLKMTQIGSRASQFAGMQNALPIFDVVGCD